MFGSKIHVLITHVDSLIIALENPNTAAGCISKHGL